MSIRFCLFAGISTVFISAISCSRGGLKEAENPRDIYDAGTALFNKGNYFKAQAEFQKLIYSYPGQPFIDTAQYYLSMSLYNMQRYPEAVGEFRRLLASYPVSAFADDAQFQLGMCHFQQSPKYDRDQEETYTAVDEFSTFLNRYPQSPLYDEARARLNELYDKLARKMFKNGELYLKLHDYDPALVYFDQVRDNYPETEWARRAVYYSGEALLGLDRKSDALETFRNFVAAFPDHELSGKARENIEKLQPAEDGG